MRCVFHFDEIIKDIILIDRLSDDHWLYPEASGDLVPVISKFLFIVIEYRIL